MKALSLLIKETGSPNFNASKWLALFQIFCRISHSYHKEEQNICDILSKYVRIDNEQDKKRQTQRKSNVQLLIYNESRLIKISEINRLSWIFCQNIDFFAKIGIAGAIRF